VAPPGARVHSRSLGPLALAPMFQYGFRERKEVMCSDRQYA
jgi:hypothetical protein